MCSVSVIGYYLTICAVIKLLSALLALLLSPILLSAAHLMLLKHLDYYSCSCFPLSILSNKCFVERMLRFRGFVGGELKLGINI